MFSDEWEEFTKDIEKLPREEKIVRQRKVKLEVTPKLTANKIYNGQRLESLEVGNYANIDANTVKRFKKGEFRIESELDLHGYTEDKAYEKVIEFVKNSYLRNKRCIAIITGKGLHQRDTDDIFTRRGVLRDWVPQWLNQADLRPLILAIDHPVPKEGGSGVIKILLRRQRD